MGTTVGPEALPVPQPTDPADGPGAFLAFAQKMVTGGPYAQDTLVHLQALPGVYPNQKGLVYNDSANPQNNGEYLWSGSAWTLYAPFPAPEFVCSAGGSQVVGTGFSQLTAWGTPDISRGFTSFTGGALTIAVPGLYDLSAEIATATSGQQSIAITKNSTSVGSGVILQSQQNGLTAFGSKPVILAVGDVLRAFGAAGAASQTVQTASFFALTFRSAL